MDIILKCEDKMVVRVNDEYFLFPEDYKYWRALTNAEASKLWKRLNEPFQIYPELVFVPFEELVEGVGDYNIYYDELELAGLIQ